MRMESGNTETSLGTVLASYQGFNIVQTRLKSLSQKNTTGTSNEESQSGYLLTVIARAPRDSSRPESLALLDDAGSLFNERDSPPDVGVLMDSVLELADSISAAFGKLATTR